MAFGKMKAEDSKNDGEFTELIPQDNYPGVLVGIFDLGTHREQYQGNDAKEVHKIFLVWELLTAKKSGSQANHTIGKEYTYSFHEKSAFRKMVEAWKGSKFKDGEDFDASVMLGRPCLVGVSNNQSKSDPEKTYARIETISGLPKVDGKPMAIPKGQYKPIIWSIGDGPIPAADWIPRIFGRPLAEKVQESPEWKSQGNGKPAPAAQEPAPAGNPF
jgi:hypothetical protein